MTEEKCPFCNIHPYEYVDIGVGCEPVAVTCCGLGHELLVVGGSEIREAARLITSSESHEVEEGKRIARKYEQGIV